MKIRKILLAILFTGYPFLFFCKDDNTVNMVLSYLSYQNDDRPTSLLAPKLCWDSRHKKTLAKALWENNMSLAHSFQLKRREHHLQYILVLVDMSCQGGREVLREAENNLLFKSPYRWLILESGPPENTQLMLESITMLVDSDVVVARKVASDQFLFLEAYKVSENTEVIQTIRGSWRPIKSQFYEPDLTTDQNNDTDFITDIKVLIDDVKSEEEKEKIKVNTRKIKMDGYGIIEDYRKSKVLSHGRHNLRRGVLTMSNVVTDSNLTRAHMDDRLHLHQDSIAKMSYVVVKICFEMLNATERLLFTHTWGYKDQYGNWSGMINHLLNKEADLGTLTIFTKERMRRIDYIAMVGRTAVRFVFREPPLAYVANIFALPFTGAVWLAILICVLLSALFLYIASKWEASMEMHQFQLDGSWADVLILIIGAVLQQGCTLEPRYAAGRVVMLLIFISLTILYAAYSANIVVLLRAPSASVRTLPDLLNSPLSLGASDFEYNRYFFKKLNEPVRKAIYDKKIAPKGKKPNFYSMKEGIAKIRQGLFAFHMELNPGYRLIQDTYQEDEKCDLVEIDYINEIDPWVPGQKRSPFRDLFKINFLRIRESGIQACNHHRLQVPRPRCSGTVATFSSVGVTDIYPALLMTLYGFLMAPAVLVMEIAYKKLLLARASRRNSRILDY